jgi:uncharacterized protein (DUF4415 family)
MQRDWKSEGEPLEQPAASVQHVIEVELDSEIVRRYQERWPDTWQERMAAVLKKAADEL